MSSHRQRVHTGLYELYNSTCDQTAVRWHHDCACASYCVSHPLPPSPTVQAESLLLRHTIYASLPLYGDYRVVCVPSQSRLAVVNDAAWHLLHQRNYSLYYPVFAKLMPDEQVMAESFVRLGLWYYAEQEAGKEEEQAPIPDELVVWLHITEQCNLRCVSCYLDQSPATMTPATGYAAVDAALRSAHRHGYSRLLLKYSGGEPLLHLPLIEQIHHYAQEQAAKAGIALCGVILSNGVGINQQVAERMYALGVDLMVSLDGLAAIHNQQRPMQQGQGSWAQVWAGIQHAQDAHIPLTISVTVSRITLAGLPSLVALLLEHKLPFTLNFYRDHDTHNAPDMPDTLDTNAELSLLTLDSHQVIAGMRAAYQVIEQNLPDYSLLGCLLDRVHMGVSHQHACGVGESYLVIDTAGGVAKCHMAIGQRVATVWDDDPLALAHADTISVQNPPVGERAECSECLWSGWCAGGCPTMAFRTSGVYRGISPLCRVYRALIPDVLRLEGRRLLRSGDASLP